MKVNIINENVLNLLEGKVTVLPSRYNAISFGDYLTEKHGENKSSLSSEQLDEEVIKFIGHVIGINNKSSDLLIPLPSEEKDETLNSFLSKYHIDKFDINFNYYDNRTKTSLKDIIIDMYNTLKVEGLSHYMFSQFDMRPLLK